METRTINQYIKIERRSEGEKERKSEREKREIERKRGNEKERKRGNRAASGRALGKLPGRFPKQRFAM